VAVGREASGRSADVRVAVIGTGYWGINHVRVFAAEPRAQVTWVCDVDARARSRAGRFVPAAQQSAEVEQVLEAKDVDAVVLVTPGATHAELTCAALAAGKHVLVEKPLAHSRAEAERVRLHAERAGKTVAVGHLMLYHPGVMRLGELLRSGELGQLYYLYATRVNLGRLRRDENALWSFGPHDISLIDYLVGSAPARVMAHGQSYLQSGVEDVVFVSLEFANRVMAHIHLSWLDPRKERRLTLVCSNKMVEFDDVSADKLRIFDKGYEKPPAFTQFGEYLSIRQGDVYIPHVAMEEPLALEARHFIECIADGKKPRADLASGIRVIAVLEAANRSLAEGGLPCAIEP
jgi:predicted dehydrogenase